MARPIKPGRASIATVENSRYLEYCQVCDSQYDPREPGAMGGICADCMADQDAYYDELEDETR